MNETENIGKVRNKNASMQSTRIGNILSQLLAAVARPSATLENFTTDVRSFNDKLVAY